MFSFSFSPPNKKPNENNNMNPRRPRPRLERRNAAKNIDYDALDASATFPPAAGPSSPQTLRVTRSLDLSPFYSNQTSFRIGGSIEGEVDLICRSLGLSGPEDFAIPTDVWDASRAQRSSSDLLPRSRLSPASRDLYSTLSEAAAVARVQDSTARVSENGGIKGVRPPTLAPPETVTRLALPTAAAEVRVGGIEPVRKTGSEDGGIKGVRPPKLTPPETAVMSITTQSAPPMVLGSEPDRSPWLALASPPLVSLPELEKVGFIWDFVRSFAPVFSINIVSLA